MVRIRLIVASLALSVAVASYAQTPAATAPAANATPPTTFSSLTTDEHIMIAPGRPPLVGKAANDEANGRAFQRFRIDERKGWASVLWLDCAGNDGGHGNLEMGTTFVLGHFLS
jgi:hypothetical protein